MNKKIGSLWQKTDKNNNTFFSGEIQLDGKDGKKVRCVVFRNVRKKENQPDYEIFESLPYNKKEQPEYVKDDSIPF